ncbi:hypothetical protein NA57DRAFT_58929 [Rhizodiscina lignyota]|uniref:Fe2OG dioxygenase domain-containing protein n=1 Tax=Rhizodiscina lignyota TaxID=1504668 RepID=A0A9P4M3M0_9PEZI|nr:hypothetical protein NA57DRAFT_58929 [Rhizodiscina lignyota]
MATTILLPSAPPLVVGPKLDKATRPTNQLPQYLADEARDTRKVAFDPNKHLNIVHPNTIYTMTEIGLEGAGISDTAASEPFSLFTPEAVQQMRAEIFSEPVLTNFQYTSDFASNMIRGYGPALAPFIFDAWKSPEVLEAISKIAGIELVTAMDMDVGHINVSINDMSIEVSRGKAGPEDDVSAFAWHRDSYPFVCVTMLSECVGMVGGETAMRLGSGGTMNVRGPAIGTAVVMQGRYIEHQALKSFGVPERISMVTAFRPKSPLIRDETVLTGMRAISNISDLYSQYTEYRLEVIGDRLRALSKKVRERERSKRPFDTAGVKNFLREQKQYIETMLVEMVELED